MLAVENEERLHLRIPEGLKEDWRRRAAEEHRSLTNWIIWMIESHKEHSA